MHFNSFIYTISSCNYVVVSYLSSSLLHSHLSLFENIQIITLIFALNCCFYLENYALYYQSSWMSTKFTLFCIHNLLHHYNSYIITIFFLIIFFFLYFLIMFLNIVTRAMTSTLTRWYSSFYFIFFFPSIASFLFVFFFWQFFHTQKNPVFELKKLIPFMFPIRVLGSILPCLILFQFSRTLFCCWKSCVLVDYAFSILCFTSFLPHSL